MAKRSTAKTAKKKSQSKSQSPSHSVSKDEIEGRYDGPRNPMTDYEALLALQASDKLYYRIGEVSRLTGVKAHVLRYWETEFRWMTPPKSRSKQRLYRSRDIEFVWLLKRLLWDERYTIAGARQRIQELGVEDALALLQQKPGAPEARTAATSTIDWSSFRTSLDEMRGELISLKSMLSETV